MLVQEGPIAFVQRETYDSDTSDFLTDFLSDFVRYEVLEENDQVDVDDEGHSLEVPPIIVFIDNIYMMDKPSWELLEKLKMS